MHIHKVCSVLAVGQTLATKSRIMKEMSQKVTGTNGQGDYQSMMFWSPLQARMMRDNSLQAVFFHFFWGTGKTLCMEMKARQRAEMFPAEKVTFIVMNDNCQVKTMLEAFKTCPTSLLLAAKTQKKSLITAKSLQAASSVTSTYWRRTKLEYLLILQSLPRHSLTIHWSGWPWQDIRILEMILTQQAFQPFCPSSALLTSPCLSAQLRLFWTVLE